MYLNDYERFAEEYAAVVDTKAIHKLYERPNTISLLPDSLAGKFVLDAGCGSGWYSEYMINQGAILTAIDISKKMLALTDKRTMKKAKCILLDIQMLSDHFEPESFDIIIAPLLIHYIADWNNLFKQFAAVLKPQGCCIFSTHQPHTVMQIFNLNEYFKKQLIDDYWEVPPVHLQYYYQPLVNLFYAIKQANLTLDIFLEPEPSSKLAEEDLELYKKLSKSPWFLFCRVIK